jgi:hypothetical protein
MKRLTLLLLGLVVGVSATARAQGLTMQMSNGWTFQFAGNVNAFWVFTFRDSSAAGPKFTNSSVRTGLLPAFATFDAKGKEGGLNVGVHIGFAPQIQNGGNAHDQFGAQIDMRQVYLTIGFQDGSQILAGRELGLFGRQNILTDMTLFGVGAVGPGLDQAGGTTLGRIGYGYLYPNFNAQVTYSSPAKNQAQFSVGLFQPSVVPAGTAVGSRSFSQTSIPRVEVEVAVRPTMSGGNKLMVWAGGEWQTLKRAPGVDTTKSAVGVTGGAKFDVSEFSVVVSYYYGSGIGGIANLPSGAIGGFGFNGDAFANSNATNDYKGRKFDGGIAQVTYTANKKTTVGFSWGYTRVKAAGTSSSDASDRTIAQWSAYTGGIYHQWTKSLKLVGEYTREVNSRAFNEQNGNILAAGFMLFF